MDMHATDLVRINGITRVLLVYICQQGVYPRGHVLPLRLPPGCLSHYSNWLRVGRPGFCSQLGSGFLSSGTTFNHYNHYPIQ
jgi:hypothetical protein